MAPMTPMKWLDVWLLFKRETRAALRERTVIVESFLVPLLLFPFILWVMFTGLTFVQGRTEGFVSRTAVSGLSEKEAELKQQLQENEQIVLTVIKADDSLEELRREVREGRLDAVLRITNLSVEFNKIDKKDTTAGEAGASNFSVDLIFDGSRERSAEARGRLTRLLDRYREEWLRQEALALGINESQWQRFEIERQNVATDREMGGFLLGMMLPLFFIISVAIGAFSPAIDTTAGERERGTWETTMSLATSRQAVITAKYLYVAAFGFLAGIINLAAMALAMGRVLGMFLGGEEAGITFAIPLGAVPLLLLGALLLSGFIAAGMMLFAAFARTYKEGQAMITPFYFVVVLPAVFLNMPGLEFSTLPAIIPVVNVALMVREAIAGNYNILPIFLTTLSSAAAIAACVALATVILGFEDLVIGSYDGSLGTFIKQRLPGKKHHPSTMRKGVK